MAVYYTFVQDGGLFMALCLSTDTKPNGVDGCIIWEMDSGKRFQWLSGSWQEMSSGPTVKSGVVNLTAGGTSAVTFGTAFASVPRVVAVSQFNTTDTSTTLKCYNVSTTGFTLGGAGNAAGNVAWIATDEGNS